MGSIWRRSMTLLTDSTRSRFTRRLSVMTVALALAATTTLAGAAGALARQPSAVVEFDSFECATFAGVATGAAGANLVTTAHGRWWHLGYMTETTDSTETYRSGWIYVRMDAKNPTAIYGSKIVVPPATTTFYIVLTDRYDVPLNESDPVSATHTCG